MKKLISTHEKDNITYRLYTDDSKYFLYECGLFAIFDVGFLMEHGTKEKCMKYLEDEE